MARLQQFFVRMSLRIAILTTLGVVSASPAPNPHGEDEDMDMKMSFVEVEWSESFDVPNYFSHHGQKFWIWSHIATMMLAWAVVLPVGESNTILSRFEILGA
jgi:hypothetical protein